MVTTKKLLDITKKKQPYPACKYLPSNVINRMKAEIIQSKKDGVEHGFVICSSAKYWEQMNNDNTTASKACTGTDCKISTTKEEVWKSCLPDKNDISYFHTHLIGATSHPSLDDIASMHKLGHGFSCIGSETEIRCFSRDIPSPKASMEKPSKDYDKFKKKWDKSAEDCIIKVD